MRKTGLLFTIIMIMLLNFTFAEDKFFQGGAGGFEMIYLPLELSAIDSKLGNVGLSQLDNSIYLQGGGGWGNVGNNIRIGGYGYGGAIPAINKKEGEMAREFEMEIGMAGVAVEKAWNPVPNSEISFRCLLGAGSIDMKIKKWSRFTDWDNLWQDYQVGENADQTPVSYQSNLNTSFFMALPSIGVRYYILDWFAVGANVGYLYTYVNKDSWKINSNDLYDAPEIDLSNTVYKVNFFFGG